MTIGPLVELCNFKSNLHETSCLSKKQVTAIINWSSGERCGPWASCLKDFTKSEQFFQIRWFIYMYILSIF